jgi:hypothetical protein
MGGSPCIDAGTDVGEMGGRDFLGNAAPSGGAYDIGACEYIAVKVVDNLSTTKGVDAKSPEAPADLAATAVSEDRIDLCWAASSDNIGVAGYRIYRNGALVGTGNGLAFSDADLLPGTGYAYTVKAYDAAGNISKAANTATARTKPRVNLALGKAVTVSSADKGDAYGGVKAVDGNGDTCWRSKAKSRLAAEWLLVDLGAQMSIGAATLKWGEKYAEEYKIEVSKDNQHWTQVYEMSYGVGGTDEIAFDAVAARYIRVYAIAWLSKADRCWLKEFEVYK